MRPVVLGLIAVVVATGCADTGKAPVRATAVSFVDSADQVFHGVQAPMESNGVKRGTLYADTLYVMNDQTRFDFIDGRVEFNTELGKPDGMMRADRGRYDQRTQVLEGWGNVVVTSVDGRSLKSPHVVFNQLTNTISSDTTFEFIADGRITTGTEGFRTNTAMTERVCPGMCTTKAAVAIPK